MSGGQAWQGACMTGCVHGGGGGACVAGETATPAGGTHPTGMHSCYITIIMSLSFVLR